MFESYDKAKKEVADYVKTCIEKAEEYGNTKVASTLRTQLRELENLRFNIAIVGNIKRGKSTLINTLLGQKDDYLSPIDTKVCTGGIVHYMDLSCLPENADNREPHAKVYYLNRDEPEEVCIEDIDNFVREENNPKNKKGVSRIEVYGRFPLLHSCSLVDTPGADAVIENHGDAVYSFLPNADAVIMTVMAGQAMTNNEQKMLKVLAGNQQRKIFYVLTKVDNEQESDIPDILRFVQEKIADAQLQAPSRIYQVACKQVFDARCKGVAEEEVNLLKAKWGVSRLEKDLESFIIKNSDQGKALVTRLEATMRCAQSFIQQKIGENTAFIETQDCDIAEIQKSMTEARGAFAEFEKNMTAKMNAFSRKWEREKEKGLSKLDSIAEKVKIEVHNLVEKAGLLKSLKNAFSLNQLVNQQIMPLYQEFALKEQEAFEGHFSALSADMCEEVDIFAKHVQTCSISSAVGASIVGSAAAYAVGGGVMAVGNAAATIIAELSGPAILSSGSGALATTLAGWFGADSFIVSLFGGSVVGTGEIVGTALAGVFAPVLVAAVTAVTAGPATRFISSLFVPGQVDKNVKKQKEAFIKQVDQARESILLECKHSIAERRDALEMTLQQLEGKLSRLSPQDKERAQLQNDELKLLAAPQLSL